MFLPHSKGPSHHFKICLSICLLLASGALIAARWKTTKAFVTQSQPAETRFEAELITVTPAGFEPHEITLPQGRFMLAVDNRSGLDEVSLYLERDTGAPVKPSLARKGKLAWREVVDLPVGTYILRAANDESWRCRITLTPR